jgi:trk system potassium uptake protein TrkH
MSRAAIRTTIHDLGWFVVILGGLALPVALVGVAAGEWRAVVGLSTLAIGALSGGFGLTRVTPADTEPAHAMRTTAIGWLLLGVLAAVPFAVWAGLDGSQHHESEALVGWIDPFFEGMSGITSTGLTVVPDPSRLPVSLQLWRSALEWLGGVGVIVLALAFADLAHQPRALYVAEARSRRLGSSLRETTRRIWGLYLGLTVVAIGSLWLAGESPWVALNHGLAAVSTGGFTLREDSVASSGAASKLTAMAIMFVGATSFGLIRAVIVRGRLSELWHSVQIRVFVPLLVVVGVLVVVLGRGQAPALDLVFQSTSSVATCGFSATATDALHVPVQVVIIIAMLAGGMVGSTAGGIKAERLAVLLQGLRGLLGRGTLPDRIRTDSGWVRDTEAREQLRSAGRLTGLLLAAVSSGGLALALLDRLERPILDYLFEATSAIGCVGLSIGLTGPELETAPKLVLAALMWIGRLEVVAIAVLLTTPIGIEPGRVVGDARLKRMPSRRRDDTDDNSTPKRAVRRAGGGKTGSETAHGRAG